MKKKFITLLVLFTNIIIITTFNSCGNDDSLDEVTSIPQQKEDPYYVNYEQALSEAIEFMHGDILRKGTRAGINLRVDNHYEYSATNRFGCKQTRSAVDNDTIDVRFHVINFANDGGFALVSADKRTTPIYAYSESGHLDLEDAIANTGVRDFMEIACENYKNEVINRVGLQPLTPVPTDSIAELLIITDEFGNQYHVSYGNWATISSVPQLVNAIWGQDNPYNYYCPTIEHTSYTYKSVVGCGPLAVGQIMSFYEYPYQIGSDSIDWTMINHDYGYLSLNNYSKCVAKLLRKIGDLSQANYDSITTTTMTNLRSALLSCQYQCSPIMDFDAQSVINSLNTNQLVLAYGQSDSNVPDDGSNAHFWVIDGYKYQEKKTTYYSIVPPYNVVGGYSEYRTFYRCNWGHNGYYNGYYLSTFNENSQNHYSYNKKCICNIHPNI